MQLPRAQFLTLLHVNDAVASTGLPEEFQPTDTDRGILMGRILNNEVYWNRLLNGYIRLGAEPTLDWIIPVHRTQGPGFQTAVVKFIERAYQEPRKSCKGDKLIGMFKWFIQNPDDIHALSASDLELVSASDVMTDTPQFYQTYSACLLSCH